ncbi:MAG: tetratricopeptide repeat protein [Balneolaceae bacterium]
MKVKHLCTFLFLILFTFPGIASAQNSEFQLANRLLQEQKFEEALPIFRELNENTPSAYIFFERLSETLINMKRYDEAIEIAHNQIDNNHSVIRTKIVLAELYHLNGDKQQAEETWNDVLERDGAGIQSYYQVAGSMSSRREYNQAIHLYEQARERFNNPDLFTNELANTYMQAGDFERAVNQYFQVVKNSPGQMGYVQQRFLRMQDDALYETAALELEDFLLDLDRDHTAYSQLYQLLSWLLMETDEYRRAFIFARQYESQTEQTNYSLYALGNRLTSAQQFELAVDAYSYYTESDSGQRFRAMEEVASTYIQWARHMEQYSLESSRRVRELYQNAYEINESLLEEAPYYNRIDRVLSSQIDLSLDIFKDSELAERWYNMLANLDENVDEPAYKLYAEGRLALFNKDFTTARQALTRADKATSRSNLSEQSRYYLSLSDFYAGDYEFSEIQLRSLERRNTSYFANNAIQLRMWIKNGLRADTTGSSLKMLGDGLHSIHTGKYNEAIDDLEPILSDPSHPFSDDITIELAKTIPDQYQPLVYQFLDEQITSQPNSPLRERMLWEKARSAENLAELYNSSPELFESEELQITEEQFFEGNESFNLSKEVIEEMYEQILLEFPGGFYAQYAREKLQLAGTEPT